MSDRLQEIRDRLEQATQGEWRVCGRDPGNPRIDAHWDDGDYLMVCEQAGRNAEFLAHAPADIRWLLERLSELETECVLRDHDLTRQLKAIAGDECVCPHPQCGHELAQAALRR
jgi:hypothetical protein